MGFNAAFKGLKLLKKPGNGRLNNLNDPSLPQCVKLSPDSTVRSQTQTACQSAILYVPTVQLPPPHTQIAKNERLTLLTTVSVASCCHNRMTDIQVLDRR